MGKHPRVNPVALEISVDFRSAVAAYRQIENAITYGIVSGRLKPGDRLPAVVGLGKQIGVNFNTVAKAYRGLEVMGLTYSRRGMGCFITEGARERCEEQCRQKLASRLFEVVNEARAAGFTNGEVKQEVATALSAV